MGEREKRGANAAFAASEGPAYQSAKRSVGYSPFIPSELSPIQY
jgi:hypothetical protein